MYCKNCGKIISDTARFCKYCGIEYIPDNYQNAEIKNQNIEEDSNFTVKESINDYKKNKGNNSIIWIFFLLIIVSGLIYYFIDNQKGNNNRNTNYPTFTQDNDNRKGSKDIDWDEPEEVVEAWFKSLSQNDLDAWIKSELDHQVSVYIQGENAVKEHLERLSKKEYYSTIEILSVKLENIYHDNQISVTVPWGQSGYTGRLVNADVASVKAEILTKKYGSSKNETIWFVLVRVNSKMKDEGKSYILSKTGDWTIIDRDDKPYRPSTKNNETNKYEYHDKPTYKNPNNTKNNNYEKHIKESDEINIGQDCYGESSFIGLGKDDNWNVIIKFVVLDKDSRTKIRNVCIALYDRERKVFSITTDNNGVGIVIIHEWANFPGGTFKITAPNYKYWQMEQDQWHFYENRKKSMIAIPDAETGYYLDWTSTRCCPSDAQLANLLSNGKYEIFRGNYWYVAPGLFEYQVLLDKTGSKINILD